MTYFIYFIGIKKSN